VIVTGSWLLPSLAQYSTCQARLVSGAFKKFEKAVDTEIDAAGADQKHASSSTLTAKSKSRRSIPLQWVVADFRTTLDKGTRLDRFGCDARITFSDGTTYTMKPDSLVRGKKIPRTTTSRAAPASDQQPVKFNWATPTFSLWPSRKRRCASKDAKAQLVRTAVVR